MINLIKKHIREQIALRYIEESEDTMNRCAEYVFNAPVWQWRLRLRIVLAVDPAFRECYDDVLNFIRGNR